MKFHSWALLWVSLLFSYSAMGDYTYNFYQGENKTTMFGSGTPPTVSFNGEVIKCHCGKVPVSILVVDEEVEAFCLIHQDNIVDAYEEIFIRAVPKSTQHSDHRKDFHSSNCNCSIDQKS